VVEEEEVVAVEVAVVVVEAEVEKQEHLRGCYLNFWSFPLVNLAKKIWMQTSDLVSHSPFPFLLLFLVLL
jgi:hypothetical protein